MPYLPSKPHTLYAPSRWRACSSVLTPKRHPAASCALFSLFLSLLFACALFVAPAPFVSAALAGAPEPWGIGYQEPASTYAERVDSFHNILLVIIGFISAAVTLLLLFVMLRFNERANPVPSRTTHNTRLEVVWTLVPVLILIVIAIFSFPLLYFGDVVPDSKYTVKVTGHQWYWSFEYETPEGEVFSFDSLLLPDEEAEARGLPRLLAVDEPMMLPTNTPVRFIVTASDVLHAFAVPAFAVKTDAVPGRLNETWAEILRPGTYYGQCSELCGTGHAYMPLMIEAVSEEEFLTWLKQGPTRYADGTPALTPSPSFAPAPSLTPTDENVRLTRVSDPQDPSIATHETHR